MIEKLLKPKTVKDWWIGFFAFALLPFGIDSFMVATQRGHIEYWLFIPLLAASAFFGISFIAKTKLHFLVIIIFSLLYLWCCFVLFAGGISVPYPEY